MQAPSGATAYFSYDAASNLTQRFLGNSVTQKITYDAAERVSQWRNATLGGASLTYFDYTRDVKGLITKSVREANYTVYYTYDPNDRLAMEVWAKTGATPSEVYGYRYSYDLTGNRTKARINGANTYYFYDQANQLKVTGTSSAYATPTYYLYDKNGSLTNVVAPSGATYFAYNAAGLVARMRWADASATYFFYDGNLQRYSMVISGTATYFLWDGSNLLQELNADGTTKEEHTNAKTPISGIGQLLETNRPGQTQQKIYPIMDPRGSISKYIQTDGATVFAAREYDAFGNLIPNSSSGTWPGRFGFQGQSWQEIFSANGGQKFLLSPTRIYDPVTGRFLQNERILKNRPRTHFLYAVQNPISIVDPLGLQEVPSSYDWQSELTQNPPSQLQLVDPSGSCPNQQQLDDQYRDMLQWLEAPIPDSEIWAQWFVPGVSNLTPLFDVFALPVAQYVRELNFEAEADIDARQMQKILFLASILLPAGGEMVAEEMSLANSLKSYPQTSIMRAVTDAELGDLLASGTFRNPYGIEVKYFSTSPNGAAWYAQQAMSPTFGPFTIVESSIPSNAVTPDMSVMVDRIVPTIVVPTDKLPLLSPPTTWNYAPVPKKP